MVEFTLSFHGKSADKHELDLYDVSTAMLGFQRSLAITTHLILNDQVITQAPSLRGANIIAIPPEAGSWSIRAKIIGAAFFGAALGAPLGTALVAPPDTVAGYLAFSALDYIVSNTLGFHVDYDQSLGKLYKELQKQEKELEIPILDQSRFDSALEKCDFAIREMHRPIVKTKTAAKAEVEFCYAETRKNLSTALSNETYEYLSETHESEMPEELVGRVSSYNANTRKGRIYDLNLNRPIPFELTGEDISRADELKVIRSLTAYIERRNTEEGFIQFRAFRQTSRAGHLKKYLILEID